MHNTALILGGLVLSLFQQAGYNDKITLKDGGNAIQCKIVKESCQGIQYYISGVSIPQTISADKVSDVAFDPNRSFNFNRGTELMKEGKADVAIAYFDKAIGEGGE